jgi:S1-C subfamily serine protease
MTTTSDKKHPLSFEGRELFILIVLILAFISLTIKIVSAPAPIETVYTEEQQSIVDTYSTFMEKESWAVSPYVLSEYSSKFRASLLEGLPCEDKLYNYYSVLDLLSFQANEFSNMSNIKGDGSCLTVSGFPKHLLGEASGIASSVFESVVRIKDGYSYGTGFFIDYDLVLTNYHVVADSDNRVSDEIEIETYAGENLKATYIEGDPRADIAVLRITNPPSEIQPLFLSAGDIEIGEPVVSIGHPSGQKAWTTTVGVYYTSESNLYGVESGVYSLPSIGGLSGSPILNLRGEVIGMVYGSREVIGSRGIDSRYQIPLHTSIVSDYAVTKAVSMETLREYYK